jgi:hypothetical protein
MSGHDLESTETRSVDFEKVPEKYREAVKRYFSTD